MLSGVTLQELRRSRGYVLILAFVLSALVETFVHRDAPPDVRWMSMAAASMYIMFEAGLFFAQLVVKR